MVTANLTDLNAEDPKSNEYTFKITVEVVIEEKHV